MPSPSREVTSTRHALEERLSEGHASGTLPWLAIAGVLLAIAICLNTGLLMSASWITVTGDPRRVDQDFIQLEQDLGSREDRHRVAHLRINHAAMVTSLTGVAYRSFEGMVKIDCVERQARYIRATYYGQPAFKGNVILRRTFDLGEEPPVRLLGFDARHVNQNVDLGCM